MFGSQFYVQTIMLSLFVILGKPGTPSSSWDIALSLTLYPLPSHRLVAFTNLHQWSIF